MEYSIHLAKEEGQIVPLFLVAHEMAKGFATRWGELTFHRPTYENALRRTTLNLIHAVQDGNLTVCDGQGRAIRHITDDLVTATVTHRDWPALREAHPECEIAPDFWDFSRADLGPGEVVNEPSVCQMYAYLRDLNAWAEVRGDSFTIEELPVQIIESDGMRAIVSAGDTSEIKPNEDSWADDNRTQVDAEAASSGALGWIALAKDIAQRIGEERWRRGERQISSRNIAAAVAVELGKDYSTRGVQGQRGEDNVRNIGLRGWIFRPPG